MSRFSALVTVGLWLTTMAPGFANGLQEWTARSLPSTNDLYAVAFGNEAFIAVGHQGALFVSANGAQWESRDSSTAATLRAITYGAGKFVAVGEGGTIITSTNTSKWVPRNSASTGELFGVAYGGGIFVAVGRLDTGSGYQGVIVTSTDGVEWRSQDSGVRNPLYAIAYGAGIYVAVGHLSAVTSADGVIWQRVNVPNYGPVYGIAYGNSRFVTAESDIYTPSSPFSVSEDGQSWRSTSAETDGIAWSVTFARGVFAAVGGLNLHFGNPTNQVAVSADGEHWTTYPTGMIPELQGITYGVGTLVAVGLSGTIVQSGRLVQPSLAIQRPPNQNYIQLTVAGNAGDVYRLQTSTNINGGDWRDWMALTNVEGTITIVDNVVTNSQQRFYRLLEP